VCCAALRRCDRTPAPEADERQTCSSGFAAVAPFLRQSRARSKVATSMMAW
jgi:hypothetical protein